MSLRSGWLNAEDFTDVGKAGSFIGQLRKGSFISIETVIKKVTLPDESRAKIEVYRVWYFR